MKKKTLIIIFVSIIAITGLSVGGYFYYDKIYLENKAVPTIKLNGEKEINLALDDEYIEEGANATFRDKDVSTDIKVFGMVDTKKVGTYEVLYTIKVHDKTKKVSRTINVKDNIAPEIILKEDSKKSYLIGTEYKEPGYSASDNYDGDITDKVEITNNINKNNPGDYEIIYVVTDSSGNMTEVTRNVKYVKPVKKALPSEGALASSIAVLNYHFFYDPTLKENNGDGNFTSVQTFEEQLKYLQDNHYKTLTTEEFRAWMYGEIDLPARSVLITVDDGGMGTGYSNGNKLIPLLEKYDMHATLFLISGWWSKSDYASPNLDIESHTHNLHFSSYCSGVSRGAKMLCLSNEEVLADLQKSIETLGSSTAFCFPFYAYSENAINIVQEAGFKLGFIGGNYKATRGTNKYKIPRFHMYKNTSLTEFNNFIA